MTYGRSLRPLIRVMLMCHARPSFVLSLVCLSAGCVGREGRLVNEHPLEENEVDTAAEHFIIGGDAEEVNGHLATLFAEQPEPWIPSDIAWVNETPEVLDVAFDESGYFYVAYEGGSRVDLFSPDGSYLHSSRGMGEAREQINLPVALDVSEKRLTVLDRHGRVHVLARYADTLAYEISFSVEVLPLDVCQMGDRVFIHGVNDDGQVLHAYSVRGEFLASFGGAYRSENRLVRNALNRGRIACVPELDVVVFVAGLTGAVRAYTSTGDLAWSGTFDGLLKRNITEYENGIRYSSPTEQGYYYLRSLTVIGGEIVAQWGLMTDEARQNHLQFEHLESFILSPVGGGRFAGVGPELVMGASDRSIAVLDTSSDSGPVLYRRVGGVADRAGGASE